MTDVYCDRLTAATARALRAGGARSVVVLDAMDEKAAAIAGQLRSSGMVIQEAQFFTGSLRRPDGEAVYLAARREAGRWAPAVARALVEGDPTLARVAAGWPRHIIVLNLAKWLALPVERVLARLMVARELGGAGVRCVLTQPPEFDARLLSDAVDGVSAEMVDGPASSRRQVARSLAIAAARRVRGWLSRSSRVPPGGGRAVMAMREDDVGLDRSYRGQPHWIDSDGPRPGFDLWIVPRGGVHAIEADPARLRDRGIHLLGRSDVAKAVRRRPGRAIYRRLRADSRACLAAAVRRGDAGARALMQVKLLLDRAGEVGAVAEAVGARVFVTGEPYVLEADAVQLVAGELGVRTVCFQYSNLAFSSPLMVSGADTMMLFAPMYQAVFQLPDAGPASFRSGGYVFDSAFARVRARAAEARSRLEAAGARFVICHFDESVQADRWGLIHEDDHRAEITALARLVAESDDVGLIVKSQFERNAPSRRYPGEPALQAAAASGRYLELRHGRHRNVVYPAEAALAADLCIGNVIGATASLEAAVAGRRSVMLNPHGLKTAWDDVYGQADILYPSLDALLHAVRRQRAGEAAAARLGDWSPILHHFDSFRDGRAAARLRALIEEQLA